MCHSPCSYLQKSQGLGARLCPSKEGMETAASQLRRMFSLCACVCERMHVPTGVCLEAEHRLITVAVSPVMGCVRGRERKPDITKFINSDSAGAALGANKADIWTHGRHSAPFLPHGDIARKAPGFLLTHSRDLRCQRHSVHIRTVRPRTKPRVVFGYPWRAAPPPPAFQPISSHCVGGFPRVRSPLT